MKVSEAADRLGRSARSVYNRAYVLGFKFTRHGRPTLADLTGEVAHEITLRLKRYTADVAAGRPITFIPHTVRLGGLFSVPAPGGDPLRIAVRGFSCAGDSA